MKAEIFGETAFETMSVEMEVGRLHQMCSLSYDNLMDGNVDAEKARRVLAPILGNSEGKVRVAATSWDATMMAPYFSQWSSKAIAEYVIT